MTATISGRQTTVESVEIDVPVLYGEEDMPTDFPFRKDNRWRVIVNINTGEIRGWKNYPGLNRCRIDMQVGDMGTYRLLDGKRRCVSAITHVPAPNRLIPGDGGNYICLNIDNGRVTNWPKQPDLSEFDGRTKQTV